MKNFGCLLAFFPFAVFAQQGPWATENAALDNCHQRYAAHHVEEARKVYTGATMERAEAALKAKTITTEERCYFVGGVEARLSSFVAGTMFLKKTTNDLGRLVIEMSGPCRPNRTPKANYSPGTGFSYEYDKLDMARDFDGSLKKWEQIDAILQDVIATPLKQCEDDETASLAPRKREKRAPAQNP